MSRSSRYSLMFVLLMLAAVAATVSLSQPAQVAASSPDSFARKPVNETSFPKKLRPLAIARYMMYPFPSELTTAASGSRIAWVFNELGARNVWVADGPDFRPRQLTDYRIDDGQEITSLSISADGNYVVYVRGGDHGSNWESSVGVNPALSTTQGRVQIFSIPFKGGKPQLLSEGDEPSISPKNDRVVFLKERAVWTVPINGSEAAKRLFYARGEAGSLQWSPDGSRLAFVSGRGDHSFIGIYTDDSAPILYVDPKTARDSSPRWSPDGKQIAFVRRPGTGGAPEPILEQRPQAWSIWTADVTTGSALQMWKSPFTIKGSPPTTHGGTNLHWAANGRIVFLSYLDGQPHLYSIPEGGNSEPLLLTPGNFMAEHISISADRKSMLFAANAGSDPGDIDRRHIMKVSVDKADAVVLTPGTGLEWTPFTTGDGKHVVYLSATAQRPPLPAVMAVNRGQPQLLAEDRIPPAFATKDLVTPKQVVFKAPDGLNIHGQLFERAGGSEKKPAIIYVHGGPPRQMLLGWHYSDYYSNAYALNQYLASRGYVVLSVNFRLGIGYGHDFHRPLNAGAQGASEYQDVKAGAEYLQRLPQVDPKRIGIYGGSYGGFLTALALARDSKLFAAGVDIHGVHNWTAERAAPLLENRYEKAPDVQKALDIAWQSSPVSSMDTWKSPVLLIHGDDDRNVRFSQTTDLVRRLEKAGVQYEELIIPDDTHHFFLNGNIINVNLSTVAFFDKVFGMNRGSE